jgi:two-component system nitrogen regulation response regulator GlnG/two-component system response regulator HydG
VLTLEDSVVLLVEERKRMWPELPYEGYCDFVFGEADRSGIVGESEATWRLREQLRAAAEADAHALITGSSGSGKELAGRAIHAWSRRAQGPLVARNAATFPDTLIDAELFGSSKNFPNVGAAERAGLVGEADGGTLILDEVGELPSAQQAHLLRVLDAGGEYQRLGESRTRRSNLRVLGLTNRAPEELKLDFLARFPIRLRVPDLAERPSDIPLLMRWIWRELASEQPELRERFPSIRGADTAWEPLVEPRLVELLLRSELAHNTRELERMLRAALAHSGGRYVGVNTTLESELMRDAEGDLEASGLDLDSDTIVAALDAARGSPTRAARSLGLRNRHVLYRLMKKHGIESRGA